MISKILMLVWKKYMRIETIHVPYSELFNFVGIQPKLLDDKILSGPWMHDRFQKDGKLVHFEDFRGLSDISPYI